MYLLRRRLKTSPGKQLSSRSTTHSGGRIHHEYLCPVPGRARTVHTLGLDFRLRTVTYLLILPPEFFDGLDFPLSVHSELQAAVFIAIGGSFNPFISLRQQVLREVAFPVHTRFP